MPSKIAYFISGHGYGHGLRSSQLINTLPPNCRVTIYTTVPESFFRREISRPIDYIYSRVDSGCVQYDALEVDIQATYEAYAHIEKQRDQLIDLLCQEFVKSNIDFVIGDIPAIPFTAAAQAGIPSLAISNFTWLDIYSQYIEKERRFDSMVRRMKSDYAHADCYARLYPADTIDFLQNIHEVGMLCRVGPIETRKSLATRLRLDITKNWCVIYPGEYGLHDVDWSRLEDFYNWQFIGLYPLAGAPQNYFRLSAAAESNYGSLIANSQMLLGKLGYGLVTECLYRGIPVAYPVRHNFREHAVLARALGEHGLGYLLSSDTFTNCKLQDAIDWATQIPRSGYQNTSHQELLNIIGKTFTQQSSKQD